MEPETTQPNTEETIGAIPATQADAVVVDAGLPETAAPAEAGNKPFVRNHRDTRKNERKPRREPRAKPEFDQKIISIRRVTRVASGGRRFSFSVAIVAGNRKGKVGVGTGKAGDTSLAIDKALKNARKNMIDVPLTKNMSIAHEVNAKYTSSVVEMMPARGRGIAAGSSVRDVIEFAGIRDITAKLRSGSKNKLNNARVAIKALSSLRPNKTNTASVQSPTVTEVMPAPAAVIA